MSIILIEKTIFCIFCILFFIFHMKMKKSYKNKLQELQKSNDILNSNLLSIKEDFTTKRNGYYSDSTRLLSINKKSSNLYDFIIYIKEIDRYTNGMSKIEMTNIEVVSGIDISQDDYLKTCIKNRFQSIKKTSDIEWLDSEESLKEMRKQKLEKIINNEV